MHGLELQIEAVRQIRGQSTAQVPDADVSMVISGPMVTPVSQHDLRHGGDAVACSYLPDGLPIPVPGDRRTRHAATGRPRAAASLWSSAATRAARFQWGPEWICHQCLSFDIGWHKVSGKGRIYSWERAWHPVHPALKDHGPYIVVLVELPDAGNVRMLGNLLGDPKQEVLIGAVLSGLVGGFFLMLSYFGCDQSQVQRYITTRSIKESRMSLVMTGILKVPMQFLILATGVFMFVLYQFERPPVFFDPARVNTVEQGESGAAFLGRSSEFDAAFDRTRLLGLQLLEARRRGDREQADLLLTEYSASAGRLQDIEKRDCSTRQDRNWESQHRYQLRLSELSLEVCAGWDSGSLMISVIFAAAMSSISGEIAALSSASMIDFYRRFLKPAASDLHYFRAGQVSTAFWGVFATFAAFFVGGRGTSLVETVNKVGSHFYGPILGVFLLAFLIKRANGHGAFFGVILGMTAVAYVSWMTQVSWLYLNAVGPVVVVATGTVISYLFRGKTPDGSHNET